MKELLEYRVKLVDRLDEAAREFCSACLAFPDPFTKKEGEWTVHQIAAHARDVDRLVYGQRVQRTLLEDYPQFNSFDADEWMGAHYDRNEPITQILGEFSNHCIELCKTLRALPREAWSRASRHATIGGELTLQLWVERGLAHIEEHLQTLKKA